MTASELQRNLIFSGYSDVTDYLKNSPVNRFLYKRLLEILPLAEIETPVVTILMKCIINVLEFNLTTILV